MEDGDDISTVFDYRKYLSDCVLTYSLLLAIRTSFANSCGNMAINRNYFMRYIVQGFRARCAPHP